MSLLRDNLFTLCVKVLTCFALASFTGCGSSKSNNPIDPSSSYDGKTSIAIVTAENAGDLASGAYGGGSVATIVRNASKHSREEKRYMEGGHPLIDIIQSIKQSTRSMMIPSKGVRSKFSNRSKRKDRFSNTGENGGTAYYDVDVNDSTGAFSGTITYEDYGTGGAFYNGKATISGTYNIDRDVMTRLTLSFRSLNVTFNNSEGIVLTGNLSWGYDFGNASVAETLTMNLVLQDQGSGKTYWFKDYIISTVSYESEATLSFKGRYYDHDYGYVEIDTPKTIHVDYGTDYPYSGIFLCGGMQETWVRIHFYTDYLSIEADTNGDGNIDWQTQEETGGGDAGNTSPVADAGSDQEGEIGDKIQLDGSGSHDPDGDTIDYWWSLDSYPNGGYADLSDRYSDSPHFTPTTVGTYVFTLRVYDGFYSSTDTVTITVKDVIAAYPDSVKQKWHYGIFGQSIGQAGLLSSDLDGDGTLEIVASASAGGFGSNTFWYVLKGDGSYRQIYRSPLYGSSISRLCVSDMNNDGHGDVIVGLSSGKILCYDMTTYSEMKSFNIPSAIEDLAVCDLDGDGKKEIITSNGTATTVYNFESGALEWSMDNAGGTTIAVGNVDGDAALEIVTSTNGGNGLVIDVNTRTVQWTYVNSFGSIVRLGDIDGDGMMEIIGAASWYKITVFDADVKSPAWEIVAELDIDSLIVEDTDHDGVPEIIYGDGQWGSVYAIDAQSRNEKWHVANPEHGVSGIALGDVDNDGAMEVLWGAGGSSTGPDYLFIADILSQKIEWKSQDIGGLSPLAVDDLDKDGIDDILIVTFSSNSGYDNGAIQIFNAMDHTTLYQTIMQPRDWMGNSRVVRTGDVDGDGNTEFVVSSADIYNGLVQIYDGGTCDLKKQSKEYADSKFSAIAIGDVDNDGHTEIVAGLEDCYVVVLNGSTLEEKWKSVAMYNYGEIYDLKIADLNKDGHPDIVGTVTGERLFVLDGVNHNLKLMIVCSATALSTGDVDNDGTLEILVGKSNGTIDVYDGVTFDLERTFSTRSTYEVLALNLADLDGNGTAEWLIGCGGALSIFQNPDEGGALIWKSGYLGSNPGFRNHISVKDVDGNGLPDIFIGSYTDDYQFEFIGMDE